MATFRDFKMRKNSKKCGICNEVLGMYPSWKFHKHLARNDGAPMPYLWVYHMHNDITYGIVCERCKGVLMEIEDENQSIIELINKNYTVEDAQKIISSKHREDTIYNKIFS